MRTVGRWESLRAGEPVTDTPNMRWYFDRLIGHGGFGVVVAVDRGPHLRELKGAMKVLRKRPDLEAAAGERWFVQELKILAGLHHPNIVKVIDVGVTADDEPYFVMELLEGQTLRQVLNDAKQMRLQDGSAVHPFLRPTSVWSFVREICSALDYAHQRKVVHRDVKPENVVLHNAQGAMRTMVVDFGIAQVHDAPIATSGFAGSDRYAPPEYLRGEPVTSQGDLYSLAVLVYEMLTLEYPYAVDVRSPKALLDAHMNSEPIPARQRDARIPARVDAALHRALAKNPEDRQPGVMALLEDLSDLALLGDRPPVDSGDRAVTDPEVAPLPRAIEVKDAPVGLGALSGAPGAPPSRHWLDAERALRSSQAIALPAPGPPAASALPPIFGTEGMMPGSAPLESLAPLAPSSAPGKTDRPVTSVGPREGGQHASGSRRALAVAVVASVLAVAGLGWGYSKRKTLETTGRAAPLASVPPRAEPPEATALAVALPVEQTGWVPVAVAAAEPVAPEDAGQVVRPVRAPAVRPNRPKRRLSVDSILKEHPWSVGDMVMTGVAGTGENAGGEDSARAQSTPPPRGNVP